MQMVDDLVLVGRACSEFRRPQQATGTSRCGEVSIDKDILANKIGLLKQVEGHEGLLSR